MKTKILDKRVLFSVFGNMFEWYDYTLYATFVPIFAKLFFPFVQGQVIRGAMAFGVFAAGYLARPIGGLLFGYIGDYKGRETALRTSVWCMTISAFAIGLLPTTQQVGAIATWMLILLRICQGISVGGEFSSSSAYLVEIAPEGKSGLYGSFVMLSLAIGIIMGSVAFLVVSRLFGEEQMLQWAWRLPFLLSLILGYILMRLRSGLQSEPTPSLSPNNAVATAGAGLTDSKHKGLNGPEGSEFEQSFLSDTEKDALATGEPRSTARLVARQIRAQTSIRQAIQNIAQDVEKNKINAIMSFCVALGDGVPFYALGIAFPSMLHSFFGYSGTTTSLVSILIMISYGLSTVVSGLLSDKFGAKKIMSASALMVSIVPFITFLSFHGQSKTLTYLISCITGLVIGLYHGSIPSFLLNSFPASSRATIVSLTYNIGITIFGATAPMVCFLMMEYFPIAKATQYISTLVATSSIIAFCAILARKAPKQ